jgi:hypothetical protein
LIGGTRAIDVSVGTSGTVWIIDDASIVSGGTVTVVSASLIAPSGE